MKEQIGDLFRLPQRALERNVTYQLVSDADMAAKHGWTPTAYDADVWDGCSCIVTAEGRININGLVLVEKSKPASLEEREDERIKPLVLNVIAARALGGNSALFSGGSVKAAWQEAKAAYDDTAFRAANRGPIIERAKRLARRAGQTPELLVSVEPPVPWRLEDMQLYFFNEQRLIPIWRLFEPLAIVQVKEEMQENLASTPIRDAMQEGSK